MTSCKKRDVPEGFLENKAGDLKKITAQPGLVVDHVVIVVDATEEAAAATAAVVATTTAASVAKA